MRDSTVKAAFSVLADVEATPSRNKKVGLLKGSRMNKALRNILRWAYGPGVYYFTFNFEIDRPSKSKTLGLGVIHKRFGKLLKRLSERKITGHAAEDEVEDFFFDDGVDDDSGKWYIRAGNKHLDIGVHARTIRKIFGDTFLRGKAKESELQWHGLMLAEKTAEFSTTKKVVLSDKEINRLGWPMWGEEKMDGWRLAIRPRTGEVRTRRGRLVHTVDHLVEQLAKVVNDDVIIDGEVMAEGWNSTQSLISTIDPSEAFLERVRKEVFFHAWDCINVVDYVNTHGTTVPLEVRKKRLKAYLKNKQWLPNIVYVKHRVLRNLDDITEMYLASLAKGREGLILKRPSAPWVSKRHWSWTKLKPRDRTTAVITGALKGRGRNRHRLGKFVVRMKNGQTLRVGGGYTDQQREDYWRDQEKHIGKKLDFEFHPGEVSKSAREPVFVTFRPDLD